FLCLLKSLLCKAKRVAARLSETRAPTLLVSRGLSGTASELLAHAPTKYFRYLAAKRSLATPTDWLSWVGSWDEEVTGGGPGPMTGTGRVPPGIGPGD